MEQSDPEKSPFTPAVLDKTVIAVPLLSLLKEKPDTIQPVIIDLNLQYAGHEERGAGMGGRAAARKRAEKLVADAIETQRRFGVSAEKQGINRLKSDLSQQYLFARLHPKVIEELVRLNDPAEDRVEEGPPPTHPGRAAYRAIYRIWPDFAIHGQITRSICTVKVDAARRSFSALGKGIVWAVLDSGIDKDHPHFGGTRKNLDLPPGLSHHDLTALSDAGNALTDNYGHGTHVAGIVAGGLNADSAKEFYCVRRHRDEKGDVTYETAQLTEEISGMAPECKLLSLKVLNDDGQGEVSNLILAIELIQQMNGNGRNIQIHGANLSVGYDFEPEWFACGQSPLCVEVDRLVRSGVVVVVAAGNTGFGWLQSREGKPFPAGLDLTINDPGNAELAITVGSTHRDMPHTYGVSYFSSKGPTGDGRFKPDLVAPGEKIVSCATGLNVKRMKDKIAPKLLAACQYVEDSGTSMAAPHVSGAIAAFLSIRREYIGHPEAVKKIFLDSATDLNRVPYFQGHGLVDLMRAIQSV
jgi:subtilisin family serine protease